MHAIIAGSGRLPELLADRLAADGPLHLWVMEGTDAPGLDTRGARRFRLEQLGSLITTLKAEGVSAVTFAGAGARPALDPTQIDAATMPLVPRMMAAMRLSDGAMFREAIAIFEEAGLTVTGAEAILPGLLPPAGIPTAAIPGARDEADTLRAVAIHASLAAADTGQACAVAAGQALALEALPGTAAMLAALALQRAAIPALPAGGIFYKAPKPGQDRRIDLPAIGPDTIAQVAAAGLSGLVVEAGGVLVLDADATIAAADEAGLFLWIRARDGAA